MPKEYNEIDNLYQDELYDSELDFNSDAMWSEINSELDKDKGKTFFNWYWVGACLLLIAGLILYSSYPTGDHSTVVESKPHTSFEKLNQVETNVKESSDVVLNDNSDENSITTTNQLSYRTVKEVTSSTPSESIFSESNPISITEKSRTNIPMSKVNLENNFDNTNRIQVSNSFTPMENTFISKKTEMPFNVKSSITQEGLNNASHASNLLKTFPLLPLLTTEQFNNEWTFAAPTVEQNKNSKNKFALDWTSTLFKPQSKRRGSYSTPLHSVSTQLMGQYNINKYFSVLVGLEYLQINEKFYWQKTVSEIEKEYIENAYFIQTNSAIEYVGDSVYVPTSRILKTRQSLNKHVFWSIPVGFEFAVPYNKYSFGISTSAVFNLSHTFSGFVLDADSRDTSEVLNIDSRSNKQLGLGFSMSPFVTRRISPKWDIKVGLPIRFSSSSWLTSSDNDSNNWNVVGLSLGLNYKL